MSYDLSRVIAQIAPNRRYQRREQPMRIIRGGSSMRSLPYADHVRRVASDQPLRWLQLGWQDFIAARAASLCLGLLFAFVGLVLTIWLWRGQAIYLLLTLASGFMLIGPALTLGFQAISRDLERRERPSFVRALLAWRANAGPILNFGLAFMCSFLLWLKLAQLIFALTFPQTTGLDAQTLLNATFFTLNGLAFIALSMALGAAMAALAFVAGAFAMPMLLDRRVDLIEAVATSFTAVMLNLPTMVLWAAMLVVLTVAGMATFYIGLIVTLPLAGHATWHAYRAVIKPEESDSLRS
jgi:uncharacterized membrane protein